MAEPIPVNPAAADPNAPIADPAALRNFLSISEAQVPTASTPPDPLFPRATREMERFTGPLSNESFVTKEQRPGVPIELTPQDPNALSGVDPWTRFETARRQTMDDQQKYLESVFGKGKVRKAKTTDDFLIEVNDPDTGKPKEIPLNERGMTVGDLAALAAEAPQIAASILAMRMGGTGGTKGAGLVSSIGRILTQLGLGATGYKAGQAGQQIETEMEQGQRPDVPGIVGQKAKEIPGQMAMDAAMAGAFKLGETGLRVLRGGPGMFQTPVEKEGLAAAKRLAGKGAPQLSYSAAEASGMPLLGYLTAYAGAKPQSAAIVQEFKDLQQGETKALMNWFTQKGGTDEQAGNELLDFLQRNRGRQQEVLDRIRETMTAQERQALEKQLGKMGPIGPFKPSAEGEAFRGAVQSAYGGVKNQVKAAYEKAYQIPGATDPDIPTGAISQTIDALKDRFPTTEGTQWLDTLKRDLAPHEAYRDLVQRRSDLWNRIRTAPADRGTKDYIFGQLSNVYTELLDAAATQLKDLRFKGLIQRANEIYKTKELPFYQQGISDVLMKAGERGAPENVELLNRFQNTDLYRRLVGVVGANDPAVGHIKGAVIDGLLGKSGTSAIDPQWISGKELGRNLQEMARNPNTREMFTDIFGNRGRSILEQARALEAMEGALPKQEVESVLKAGAAPAESRRRLEKILAAQNQLDKVEAKRLLSAPNEFINPEDLANRYVPHLTESELMLLERRLRNEAPALLGQLRDKLTEQIIGKAGTYRNLTQSSLEKVLNDPKMASKYRMLLGPERFQDIGDFAKALGPRDRADEIARATGLLIKGESIGELAKVFSPGKSKGSLVGRVMGIVPGWLGWKIAARTINSGAFREWASRGYPPGWGQNVLAGVISEPFMEELATKKRRTNPQ